MRSFKRISNKQIGSLLAERGVVNSEQVKLALQHQKEHGGLIGEILVEMQFATEKDIAQALTTQYGFPYLPLENYMIDDEIAKSVPENVCRQYCLIPVDKIGKSLTLAMADPLNEKAAEDVEMLTGCIVQTFVSTSTEIRQAIDKYHTSS